MQKVGAELNKGVDEARARKRYSGSLQGLHFCPRRKRGLLKGFEVEKDNDEICILKRKNFIPAAGWS